MIRELAALVLPSIRKQFIHHEDPVYGEDMLAKNYLNTIHSLLDWIGEEQTTNIDRPGQTPMTERLPGT